VKAIAKRHLLRLRVARRLAGYRDGLAGRQAQLLDEAYQAGWRRGHEEREQQLRPRGAR
jgi:hypothetical protein